MRTQRNFAFIFFINWSNQLTLFCSLYFMKKTLSTRYSNQVRKRQEHSIEEINNEAFIYTFNYRGQREAKESLVEMVAQAGR